MNVRALAPADVAVPTACVAVLAVVSAMGFRGVFPDWTFASAAVIGAVGAALVMLVARWARLVVGEALLLSLVAFVALGAVAAEGVPTPGAFGTFFDGLIGGWAKVLSSSTPADLTPEFRVLPFTIAWAGSMLGAEMVRSVRVPGVAALGPIVALAVSLLITVEDRAVAVFQGVAMVVGAVLLGVIQQRLRGGSEADIHVGEGHRSRGLAAAGIALVVIASIAPVLGPRMPLANAQERFDLRQYQTPPFDPLREPSPLTQLKAQLQVERADTVVFRVSAEDGVMVDRFSVATLTTYNGVSWTVADEKGDPSAEFRPVDSIFPSPTTGNIDEWDRQVLTIEIVDYDDLGAVSDTWLPIAGWPISIDADRALDLRYNAATGTVAVVPGGVPGGLRYDLVVAVPPVVDDETLRDAGLAPVTGATGDDLSPPMRAFAAYALEGAAAGYDQLRKLQLELTAAAYDSSDNSRRARAGHSKFRLSDFLADPARVVGFEEQYAAAAALIARASGIPTRVVVGYRIPDEELESAWADGEIEVTAGQVGAWIEVSFDGLGWMPFDVTPDRDSSIPEQPIGITEREVAAPNPPPEPPPPELPPRFEEEEEFEETELDDEDDADLGLNIPIGSILKGTAYASPIIFLVIAAFVVVSLKTRRTRRRRETGTPSRRVAGAWHEMLDRYREDGVAAPAVATPKEFAHGLIDTGRVAPDVQTTLMTLADQVTVASCHPQPAAEADAAQAWEYSTRVIDAAQQRRSRVGRLRTRFDPRPLFKADPVALPKDTNA